MARPRPTTTTRIPRVRRRALGILAEVKGTQLHEEMEEALGAYIDRPDNAEILRRLDDPVGKDGES